MATLVLGSVGAATGSILGGPLGGALGRFAGAFTGRIIDNKLFSTSSYSHSSGPRLKDLQVQTSGYGMMIPIIFGTVRIAGNIIWARPIKEIANVANHRRRVKGSRINHAHTEYSYFASFAISICEGEISELNKIFVVNKELNLENYNIRIYRGTETQKPDILIESFEGIDSTPAFRGQAYVVFEDLPLFEFGNYIPNFVFEVTRKVFASDEPTLANTVSSVVIIPGGGEYVYDTVTQYKSFGNKINNKWCNLGKPESINHHTSSSKTNAVVATLDLKETLPKVEWVAVVVNWFGTSLDIAKCTILPGVEYNDKTAYNHPDLWYVENFSRSNAHKISQTDGRANYGGTINDASLIRYVKYLKSLNYKVMLNPMIFMDLVGKPWRGLISGEYDEVENFFNKKDGYNRFITHYCNLLKDDVDAFIIGSEMKSITSIKNDNNHFIAVSQLVALAGQCRKILGKNTIITYAADWSEYHHADGGWFHMDELWSSDNIDVIGIDAYFPLSNTKQSLYDIKEIQNGWLTGEGYDFYYTDETRKTYKKLENKYAWKNIRWWWQNIHINPDGTRTQWRPMSKKIWFTEYGFSSVDCTTNQPNIFYNNDNNQCYPIHSKGLADFKAQASAIIATEMLWQNSNMIENKFLWCWDARPYPSWPSLKQIWSDGNCWNKGHWIQGKSSLSSLCGVLEDLSCRSTSFMSITGKQLSYSDINHDVNGFAVDSQMPIKAIIEMLQKVYNFEILEKEGSINFLSSNGFKPYIIPFNNIARVDSKSAITIKKTSTVNLPCKIYLNYLNAYKDYQIDNHHYTYETVNGQSLSLNLPIIIDELQAAIICKNIVQSIWDQRNYYIFFLPFEYMYLMPLDIVEIKYKNKIHKIKILTMQIGKNYLIKIECVSFFQPDLIPNVSNLSACDIIEIQSQTSLEILDLPLLPQYELNESYVLVGVKSFDKSSSETSIYISLHQDQDYQHLLNINKLMTYGNAINTPMIVNPLLIDYESKIIINLEHGELTLAKNDTNSIHNVENLCIIGNELISFHAVKQLSEFQYEISILQRGRYGTESAVCEHKSPERFILIDSNLTKIDIPLSQIDKPIFIKAVNNGFSLGSSECNILHYQANSLKAISPIHLELNSYSNDEIQLNWIRRNRKVHDLIDYHDIPQESKEEKYLVHFINKDPELNKSFLVNQPNINFDKDLIQNCLEIKVCQFNDFLKEGFYGSIQLNV